MIGTLLGTFALSWASWGMAQEPEALQVRSDALLLVERGDLPLVVSVPHGGTHFPDKWVVRTDGVKVRDTNTYELSLALRDAIRRRIGGKPFLIASRVHRRHLDLNRNREESGANLGEGQLRLWRDYHEAIEKASKEARALGAGGALLIDVHGHGHDHGLIELGFAITAEDLRKEPSVLEDEPWVRGARSLGARLDALEWPSVPSPTRPAPKVGEAYFNGGYIVRRHRGDGLRSIQIELPPSPRRLDVEGRQPLVEGLADAILGLLVSEFAVPPMTLRTEDSQGAVFWGPGEHVWSSPVRRSTRQLSDELPRVVNAYGIPVMAAPGLSEERFLECARRFVQHMDRDSNRLLDDVEAADRLRRVGFAVVIYREQPPILASTRPWGQVELVRADIFETWLETMDAAVKR